MASGRFPFFSLADLKTISAPRHAMPRRAMPLARAAGHFYRAAKICYTRQTEFSAIEKRTVGKYECYAKLEKMYAREHIYGIDGCSVFPPKPRPAGSNWRDTFQDRSCSRYDKPDGCHASRTDLSDNSQVIISHFSSPCRESDEERAVARFIVYYRARDSNARKARERADRGAGRFVRWHKSTINNVYEVLAFQWIAARAAMLITTSDDTVFAI